MVTMRVTMVTMRVMMVTMCVCGIGYHGNCVYMVRGISLFPLFRVV